MKALKYIALSLTLLSVLPACNVLDLSPEDYYGSGNFWTSEAQVNGYMIGLHTDFRSSYSMYYVLGEARGGTSKSGTSSQNTSLDYSSPVKDNTFTKDKTGVSSWNGLYSRILQVNLFIQQLTEATTFLNETDRAYYLGQAYGMRANYYFMLYRTYGGVPLIDRVKVLDGQITAESLYKERATAKATFDFIKKDIELSEANFGNNETIKGNKAMWSKPATMMLKTEVYLWSAKVTTEDQSPAANDINIAREAITSVIGKFSLLPSYPNVFSEKGNNEVILALRFEDGEATNFASSFTYSDNVFLGQVYGKEGELIATDTLQLKNSGMMRNEYKWGLFASMDDADTRKRNTFLDYYDKDGNAKGLAFRKCIGIINTQGNRVYQNDYIVYRYAEALLLMAEIENQLGNDIAPYINEVRKRAYAEKWDNKLYGYTNASFEENEFAILHERDKEFVWEGKRWFDLVRLRNQNGQALAFDSRANYDDSNPVIQLSEAYKLLWPIDINTLNNDPELVNNPGYN